MKRVRGVFAFAVLTYVPLLLSAPGKVVADTKSYLYLDPGRLLASASSMWGFWTGSAGSSTGSFGATPAANFAKYTPQAGHAALAASCGVSGGSGAWPHFGQVVYMGLVDAAKGDGVAEYEKRIR